MTNNFDFVAPFYDWLSKLVFGDRLKVAQQRFLAEIPDGARVLIAGGGTGEILEWLPQQVRLSIDFVELSGKMISRAKERRSNGSQVFFKQMDVRQVQEQYDVIIANFFLDCFSDERLYQVVLHLKELLLYNGTLLVTDFAPPQNYRQKLLSKLMHLLFRISTRLESRYLNDIHEVVQKTGFQCENYATFYNQFLFAGRYQILPDNDL